MKTIITIVFSFLGLTLFSQEAIATTGNNIVHTSGTVNYTIGQLVYKTNSANGSVAQGVQQPFEIQVLLGITLENINLQIITYPNPTTNQLTLFVQNESFTNLTYQLFDLQGRSLKQDKILESKCIFSLKDLSSSTYILKVFQSNKVIKIFKIIKK